MNRRYKTVETIILSWVMENQRKAMGWVGSESAAVTQDDKPYHPTTPLHSPELYWDSQFVRAS